MPREKLPPIKPEELEQLVKQITEATGANEALVKKQVSSLFYEPGSKINGAFTSFNRIDRTLDKLATSEKIDRYSLEKAFWRHVLKQDSNNLKQFARAMNYNSKQNLRKLLNYLNVPKLSRLYPPKHTPQLDKHLVRFNRLNSSLTGIAKKSELAGEDLKAYRYNLERTFLNHVLNKDSTKLLELYEKMNVNGKAQLKSLLKKIDSNKQVMRLRKNRTSVKHNEKLINSVLENYPQGALLQDLGKSSGVTRERARQVKQKIFETPLGLLEGVEKLQFYNKNLNYLAAKSGLKGSELIDFRAKLGKAVWKYAVALKQNKPELILPARHELNELLQLVPKPYANSKIKELLEKAGFKKSNIDEQELLTKIKGYLDAGHPPHATYWKGSTSREWKFAPSFAPWDQARTRTEHELKDMHNLYTRVQKRTNWSDLLEQKLGVVPLPMAKWRELHEKISGKKWYKK